MDATFWLVFVLGLFLIALNLCLTVNGSNRCLGMKVDRILSHLGLDPDKVVNEKIVELVKTGQKILAVKLYREHTSVGLKEAKDYVESLQVVD